MPATTPSHPSRPTPATTTARRGRTAVLAAAALALLLVLAGCTRDDVTEGDQPALGGDVTEPEQGVAEAGEAQLAPGAGVADPAEGQADPQNPGADVGPDAVTGDTAFVPGEFAQIPLPTSAQPYGQAMIEDDVVVQSFRVTASSPQTVISFYEEEMSAIGWEQDQEDSSGETGQDGAPSQLRTTFTRDDQTILITATELDQDDTQLTLQLSGA